MGSVISSFECPVCKNEDATEDYYYKTDEIYAFCDKCGYYMERSIVRDDKGLMILKDKDKPFKYDNVDWNIIENMNPYGAYRIEFNTGGAQVGSLDKEGDYNLFKESIKVNIDDNPNIVSVIISSFYTGQFNVETIYQK